MSTPNAKRSGISNFPEDAILEILLRLPVLALLRCKCVCKTWYKIITSKSFVNQHLGHGSNQERLLIRHHKQPNDFLHPYAFALFVDETLSRFEEPDHLQMPDNICLIMGPVNGVFCLVGKSEELALLNPATRQLKPLPKQPDVFVERYLHVRDNVLGFGLDPLSGDIKVVSIWSLLDYSLDDVDYPPLVFVYNLSSNSWRNVASFKSRSDAISSYFNQYLNGVYYWILESCSANVAGILAFDMVTEEFREIEVPECVRSKELGHITIYGDSLALLSYDEEEIDTCDVWVMEEEGSWIRVAVVAPYEPICWPVCFWKNNELLLQNHTAVLTLYNICTKDARPLAARLEQNASLVSWVFSYRETLVSIKGEGDNCLTWDASVDILKIAWAKERPRRRSRRYRRRLRLLKW